MVYVTPAGGLARSYVIAEKEGLAVVDVGSLGTAEDVANLIKQLPGRSLRDVRCVVATHFHIDHIGGIGCLLEQCSPDAMVLFHFLADQYLQRRRRLSRLKNWTTGLLPAVFCSARYVRRGSHLKFESLAGIPLPLLENCLSLPYRRGRIRFLQPKPEMPCSLQFGDWEILATPGHTEDSLSMYNASSEELICGDLILNFRKNGPGYLNAFCWSRQAVEETHQYLTRKCVVKTIYPGHGEAIRSAGNALSGVKTFFH